MGEQILREPAARSMLGKIGRTKFRSDFRPRLQFVKLGPKAIGYTQSSVERLIQELIDESGSVPVFDPMPNELRRAGRVPSRKKTKRTARR
jgi:hypothetical protein